MKNFMSMNPCKGIVPTAVASLLLAGAMSTAQAQSFNQGFDDTTVPADWTLTNNSTKHATGNPWGVGDAMLDADGNPVVTPFDGAGFAIANYSSIGGTGAGTISNWLISPEIFGLQNGDTFTFYTTTTPGSEYPDGLELRLSSAGASVNVGTTTTSTGDFSSVLTTVNSGLAVGGYPESWTQISVTVSGLAAPIDGRVAFRYFVTDGGPGGDNSNIIGVDDFAYTAAAAVPEPSSYALLLAGLVAVGSVARRRRAR